jgi:hypothetical protein
LIVYRPENKQTFYHCEVLARIQSNLIVRVWQASDTVLPAGSILCLPEHTAVFEYLRSEDASKAQRLFWLNSVPSLLYIGQLVVLPQGKFTLEEIWVQNARVTMVRLCRMDSKLSSLEMSLTEMLGYLNSGQADE